LHAPLERLELYEPGKGAIYVKGLSRPKRWNLDVDNGKKTMKAIICGNLSSNLYSRKNLIKAIIAEGWELVALACPDHSVDKIETELGIPFFNAQMENKGTGIFQICLLFFRFTSFTANNARMS